MYLANATNLVVLAVELVKETQLHSIVCEPSSDTNIIVPKDDPELKLFADLDGIREFFLDHGKKKSMELHRQQGAGSPVQSVDTVLTPDEVQSIVNTRSSLLAGYFTMSTLLSEIGKSNLEPFAINEAAISLAKNWLDLVRKEQCIAAWCVSLSDSKTEFTGRYLFTKDGKKNSNAFVISQSTDTSGVLILDVLTEAGFNAKMPLQMVEHMFNISPMVGDVETIRKKYQEY